MQDHKKRIIDLDVRGEICPEPFLKAMKAMRGAGTGTDIEMLTDFLPAVLAVTNGALKEGWNIDIRRLGTKEWKVCLTRELLGT